MGDITQKWVDILQPFSNNYAARLSASSLARLVNSPQQTVSRYLNELSENNILNYTFEGRNKLFYLELEKQTTRTIFNLIENQKALHFQLEHKAISIVINEILKHCESLVVFGSYASSSAKKGSDLDIVISGKCDKEEIKKIKQRQAIEINEHYVTFKEFEELLSSRNPLAIEIKINHVLFGNVAKLVDVFLRRSNGR